MLGARAAWPSLMDNDRVLRGSTVIKLVPGQSVSGLEIGDSIRLDVSQFQRLLKAFLAEIQARFA